MVILLSATIIASAFARLLTSSAVPLRGDDKVWGTCNIFSTPMSQPTASTLYPLWVHVELWHVFLLGE